jgi:hypothetical protein
MTDWVRHLLVAVAAGETGSLKLTYGTKGCFSEDSRWIELRWTESDCCIRAERADGSRLVPPKHVDRAEGCIIAEEVLLASMSPESDLAQSTTFSFVEISGEFSPGRAMGIKFQATLTAGLGGEGSRRAEQLASSVEKVCAGRTWIMK